MDGARNCGMGEDEPGRRMPTKKHVVKIVSACAKRNALAPADMPGLITSVHAALVSVEEHGTGGGAPPAS